jgi:cytochrome c-type biogenesis protein CcmH/NrfG
MPEFSKKNIIICVYSVLILSTLLVFWQVRNFNFLGYDDNSYVYENPFVLNGLTKNSVIWAFTTTYSANWHPLTWLSHMFDCQFFDKNPGRMHLVNLFLHLANTLLLFTVFRKMTGKLWQSAFVAAAFALHPMHVESVAWISERKDVLSTLFWLLTMYAYVRYVEIGADFQPAQTRPGLSRTKLRKWFSYVAALVFFALGLMSKSMLVTLPFVLLLLDYWPLNKIRNPLSKIRNLLLEKIPFFVLAGLSCVITFLAQRSGSAIAGAGILSLIDRIANAFLSYARYLGKLFVPKNLAVFYPFDSSAIQTWQVVMCVLLLIVITILVIYFGRNRKYLPVGWFWYVGTLVPVIGFVQVGAQAYADRYTYIPYTGLFIMLAWDLPEILTKWQYRKFALNISTALVLAVLGMVSYRQVGYWKNNYTLFLHAVEATNDNAVAYNNLGNACLEFGRYQDAVESLKQALKIKPGFVNAYLGLGMAYVNLGKYQDAIEAYQQVIKIRPDLMEAYLNLGAVYRNVGRWQEAIETYREALRIKPDFAEAYFNLGNACLDLDQYKEAIDAFRQAIRIKPYYVDAHFNLGIAYLAAGDKYSAIEEYKILKTIDVKEADQLYSLINK